MAVSSVYGKIFRLIVKILDNRRLDRRTLIYKCMVESGMEVHPSMELSAGSPESNLRSQIGSVLEEMESRNVVSTDTDGLYYIVSKKPVLIRIERCEKEILRALTEGDMTKADMRVRLQKVFGTDRTSSSRDDDTLFSFMGQLLKRLESMGVIKHEGKVYSLTPRASAKADDMNAMLDLRSKFIARLHSRGGEFFENYFMTLLAKYVERHGKRVIECYVSGGSDDGGIDGTLKTEDSLGFREITMVQTKNRVEIASETDVRGFYGAVNAKRGTRGIFATTSDFHDSASKFLESLDDCVGINGNMIFKMATECLYGIKKSDKSYFVDTKLI